ncbi:MAG: ABC transporter permease, partial [Chloroflexota bacterium]
ATAQALGQSVSLTATAAAAVAFDMPGGTLEFFLIYISLAIATMAGMMLGLFASALAPNANAAPLIVILFMLPQIVLGGALVPLPETISSITSTKWAFQGFMAITAVGSDLKKDACWLLPEDVRTSMSEEDKIANGCNCLGTNALREESCNFPGMGAWYNPEIDNEAPAALGPEPVRPPDVVVPDPPPEPENQADSVAVAEYLAALQVYQAEVEQIQTDAKAAFATYEAQIVVYQAEAVAFQEALIRRQAAIASSVQPVEGSLFVIERDFGWAFVDKDNPALFWPFLFKTWAAQVGIMIILFTGILYLQKRKDVN